MLSLVLLLAAPAIVCAIDFVSGIGRSSLGSNPVAQFNLDTYSSAIASIASSVNQGPNRTNAASLPVDKFYGVNIGNWLLFEPWMSPSEWIAMGGEFCDTCSNCRQSEWALANYLGREKTNAVFKNHWETWLTQADVDAMVAAKLNTVRVPAPFWIVEDIVDKSHEPYAEGGLDELIRGLTMFKNAGLHVILDHHALPGVAASGQMFAGNCTDQVEFYDSPDDYNYKRAVTWSIVMAYLSHVHPAFANVFSIEAVNEPLQDASKTPGLDRFEKAFVLGIRGVEFLLGVSCDDTFSPGILTDTIGFPALQAALPIMAKLSEKYRVGPYDSFNFDDLLGNPHLRPVGQSSLERCLSTSFMNRDWQYNHPSNPSNAAHGPQIYDNHLYFNFGGVANATEESYMRTICETTRVEDNAAIANSPLYTGEWSLATNFETSSEFLKKWGDAQKLAWVQGAGWIFWTWKVDQDAKTYPILGKSIQWSYRDALEASLFTPDPTAYFDKNVCAPYLNHTATN